jgi:hypothetical protein
VIRRIGVRPIQEYQDVVDACYYLTAGEVVLISVMRGLEVLEVEVTPSVRSEREDTPRSPAAAAPEPAGADAPAGE